MFRFFSIHRFLYQFHFSIEYDTECEYNNYKESHCSKYPENNIWVHTIDFIQKREIGGGYREDDKE